MISSGVLLAALAGLMFAVTRRATGSRGWALVGVESLALIYQIFWRWHETHTHLFGAMVFGLAAMLALMRHVDYGRRRDALWLGLVLGLGCLTQLTFPLLVGALLIAGLRQSAMRQRLFTWRLWLALPPLLLIVWPYAAWLLADTGRQAAFVASLAPTAWADAGAPFWTALREGLMTPLLALSPYLIFLVALFPRLFQALFRHSFGPHGDTPDWTRLFVLAVLLEWGLFLLLSVLADLQRYSVQDLLPLLLPGVVALTDGARRSAAPDKMRQRYMKLALAISAIALLVRFGHMYVHEPICKTCRWGEPYAQLAEHLEAAGFHGGTIYTGDSTLGGNLRAYLPASKIVLTGDLPNTCTPPCLLANPGPAPADRPDAVAVDIPWHHLWKPTGYRVSSWWYVLTDPTRAP